MSTANSGIVPSFGSDLRISAYPQIDENKYPDIYGDLQLVHNAIRVLQQYLDAFTGAKVLGRATTTISVGQFVSFTSAYSDIVGVALANATGHTLPCHGFAVSNAVAGQGIDIQTFGLYPYGNYGLQPGTLFYLNTTAGGATATAPVGAGKLVQELGVAVDSSNILFRPAYKYTEL